MLENVINVLLVIFELSICVNRRLFVFVESSFHVLEEALQTLLLFGEV